MSGIYIHIPFCNSKCIYCNFYSVVNPALLPPFINSLCKEVALRKDYLNNLPVRTLYFGGGTPSLLSSQEIDRLLNVIYQHFSLEDDVEITFEANPEQLSIQYLRDLKSSGINRLSIGIQSFDDDILSLLKRNHTGNEARKALERAFSADFNNISADLIYGICQRKPECWQKDINTLFSFPVTHLSAYSLTVEENTLLCHKMKKSQFPPLNEDCSVQDYKLLLKMSVGAGFEHYEISNFARNGMISRHNYSYWTAAPYLGLGPSAHSYNGLSRQWNVADIKKYISSMETGFPDFESEILTTETKYNEFVMLRLRTSAGVDLAKLHSEFGDFFYDHFLRQLTHINKIYYDLQHNRFILTEEGKLMADGIAAALFFN